MRRATWISMVCAALLSAACGGGGGGGGIQAAIQGSWMRCQGAATTSMSLGVVFSGRDHTETVRTDGTPACTGSPTSEFIDPGTFVLGAPFETTLDGAPVTAYALDVMVPGFETFHDLVYLDTAATPNRLYLGELSGGLDGSTPALRPTALDTFFLTRQ